MLLTVFQTPFVASILFIISVSFHSVYSECISNGKVATPDLGQLTEMKTTKQDMPPGWYGEPHINVMKARVFSKEAISHGQVIVLKKKEKDSYVQQSFTLNHGTPDVKRQYVLMFEYSAKGHVRRMAPNQLIMNVELDGAILNGFPHNAKSGTFKSIVSIGDGTHLLKFSNTKAPVVQHYEVGFKDVSLLPVDDFGSDS